LNYGTCYCPKSKTIGAVLQLNAKVFLFSQT